MRTSIFRLIASIALVAMSASAAAAQSATLYSAMHWREIGPTRAGRARALAGVPSQPNVFYIGFDNGGVWRSTDYGSNWEPLFDQRADGLDRRDRRRAVEPEHHLRRHGRGHHPPRSRDRRRRLQVDRRRQDVDASRPARHADDRDDRRRPHESQPAVRRGARPPVRPERRARHFPLDRRRRRRFEKVLYKDEYTSGNDVRIDPEQSEHRLRDALAAAAELHRRAARSAAPSGGIFKSTDGGTTWKQLTDGLPPVVEANLGDRAEQLRACVYATIAARRRSRAGGGRSAVARRRPRRRLLQDRPTAASTGTSRSRSANRRATRLAAASADEPRRMARIGGGDLPTIAVDPKNRTSCTAASTVFWRTRRRRADLVRRARRARRRRLSEDVDQSQQPGHHPARERPGRRRLRQSRRVVEQLVHAADGGDVSRHDRQRISVSRVRRPAGLGLGLRRQPLERRRDHVPRLASGQHPGVRRSPRPIRRTRTWSSAARANVSRSTIARPARRRRRPDMTRPGAPASAQPRVQPQRAHDADRLVAD